MQSYFLDAAKTANKAEVDLTFWAMAVSSTDLVSAIIAVAVFGAGLGLLFYLIKRK